MNWNVGAVRGAALFSASAGRFVQTHERTKAAVAAGLQDLAARTADDPAAAALVREVSSAADPVFATEDAVIAHVHGGDRRAAVAPLRRVGLTEINRRIEAFSTHAAQREATATAAFARAERTAIAAMIAFGALAALAGLILALALARDVAARLGAVSGAMDRLSGDAVPRIVAQYARVAAGDLQVWRTSPGASAKCAGRCARSSAASSAQPVRSRRDKRTRA